MRSRIGIVRRMKICKFNQSNVKLYIVNYVKKLFSVKVEVLFLGSKNYGKLNIVFSENVWMR